MTSRFMQAALKSLNKTTEENPGSICTLDIKSSSSSKYTFVYYENRHKFVTEHTIYVDIKFPDGKIETRKDVLFRLNQRWYKPK